MSSLHRAQVYIGVEQMCQLRIEAEREHLTVSEIIRRAIQFLLETKKKSVNWDKDPLTRAVGKIKLTENDVSMNHDHYLYNSRKKK